MDLTERTVVRPWIGGYGACGNVSVEKSREALNNSIQELSEHEK